MNANHHLPSPICAQIAPLLPVLDDAALSIEEATLARAHVATCPHCQAERAYYIRLDEELRHHFSPAALPRRPTEDIMHFISDHAPELPPRLATRPPSRSRTALSSISAVAAVALIAVLTVLVFHNRMGPGANLGPKQYTLPGTQGLFASISMVSPTEGWALGQITHTPQGNRPLKEVAFYHYHNGIWTPDYVPTREDFSLGGVSGFNGTISLDSATDGWAVAHNFNSLTAVFHYTNGAWNEVETPPLVKIQALSAHSVWAIGGTDFNQTTITHFGGSSWTTQPITGLANGTTADPMDLTMTSDAEGWAIAALRAPDHSFISSVVLRYANAKWTPFSKVSTDSSIAVGALAMVSDTEGWALGEQTNSGARGNTTHVPYTPVVLHFAHGAWQTTPLPVTSGFTGPVKIAMNSATDGWIVGTNTNAYVGATTNQYQQHTVMWHYNGSQWQLAPFPALGFTVDSVTDLAFTSTSTGWASGYTSDIPSSLTVQDNDILARAMPVLLTYHDGVWQIIHIS